MASLGVRSMKIGATLTLGEWACDELRELSLTPTEELEAFEKYIPEFFEDGAPLSVMLSGTFSYDKGEECWAFNCYRPCSVKWEGKVLSCPSIKNAFYVGADGMVAPCMGMCDCGYSKNFPNLYEAPLREILGNSHFMDLCATTVKQVRDGNDKCRKCEFIDKCTGGCRNTAIIDSDNFYDVDKSVCFFYENGWEDRLSAVIEEHYTKYCEKNGLTPQKRPVLLNEEEIMC
jgi:radical SAM protein with 4Fe4S-binding SPASM domain